QGKATAAEDEQVIHPTRRGRGVWRGGAGRVNSGPECAHGLIVTACATGRQTDFLKEVVSPGSIMGLPFDPTALRIVTTSRARPSGDESMWAKQFRRVRTPSAATRRRRFILRLEELEPRHAPSASFAPYTPQQIQSAYGFAGLKFGTVPANG